MGSLDERHQGGDPGVLEHNEFPLLVGGVDELLAAHPEPDGRGVRTFSYLYTGELVWGRRGLRGKRHGNTIPENNRPELLAKDLVGEHVDRRQAVPILEELEAGLEIGAVEIVHVAALDDPVAWGVVERLADDVAPDQLSRLVHRHDRAEEMPEGSARNRAQNRCGTRRAVFGAWDSKNPSSKHSDLSL